MHMPLAHSSHIFSNILSTFKPETASNMDFDFSFLDTFSPAGNTEFSLAGTSQDSAEIATSEGMFELALDQLAGRTLQSLSRARLLRFKSTNTSPTTQQR
jgi:hypothetical protein